MTRVAGLLIAVAALVVALVNLGIEWDRRN